MQFETHIRRAGVLPSSRPAQPELVLRLQQREPAAWEELFNALFPKLYAYALRVTGDPTAAQDIASETFVRAFRDIERFADRGLALETWLFAIAHHRVVDLRRQLARRRLVPLSQAEDVAEPAGDGLSPQRLLWAIQALPPEQRAVVLLRFYGRLSGQETAAVLGKSHGAIRQLQLRALRAVKAQLKPNQRDSADARGAGQ